MNIKFNINDKLYDEKYFYKLDLTTRKNVYKLLEVMNLKDNQQLVLKIVNGEIDNGVIYWKK